MFEEIDSVVFDGTIVERANGDDGQLRAGFLLQLGAERFQAFASGGRNHTGEIGDVAGWRNVVDVVRESRARDEKEKKKNERARAARKCHGGKRNDPRIHKNGTRNAAESSIAAFAKKCKRSPVREGKEKELHGDGREKTRSTRRNGCNLEKHWYRYEGLDLRTVGAGKPRGEEETSKDKIEVESM